MTIPALAVMAMAGLDNRKRWQYKTDVKKTYIKKKEDILARNLVNLLKTIKSYADDKQSGRKL